jgi:polyhydroxyalkanoate synthesis regulator phasin
MSSDPITQTLQKGFRMAIGAGASFVESVQDARKWDENLQKLTTDFESLSQEWEEKGTLTEQEARTVLDRWVSQQGFNTGAGGSNTVTTTASTVATPDVEADLKDLTAQVSALRAELEALKNQG